MIEKGIHSSELMMILESKCFTNINMHISQNLLGLKYILYDMMLLLLIDIYVGVHIHVFFRHRQSGVQCLDHYDQEHRLQGKQIISFLFRFYKLEFLMQS